MDAEQGGEAVAREGVLSPADKARLPGGLQFAAVFVFLLGMIGIWRMAIPVVVYLSQGGDLHLIMDFWAIPFLLAARGLLRVSRTWRMITLALLWLDFLLLPAEVWRAGRDVDWPALMLYFIALSAPALLLMSRRAKEPFGLPYAPARMTATLTAILVLLAATVASGALSAAYLR